jgi:hypothetical protein
VQYSTELRRYLYMLFDFNLPVQNQNFLPFSIKTHNEKVPLGPLFTACVR